MKNSYIIIRLKNNLHLNSAIEFVKMVDCVVKKIFR